MINSNPSNDQLVCYRHYKDSIAYEDKVLIDEYFLVFLNKREIQVKVGELRLALIPAIYKYANIPTHKLYMSVCFYVIVHQIRCDYILLRFSLRHSTSNSFCYELLWRPQYCGFLFIFLGFILWTDFSIQCGSYIIISHR